MKASTLNLTNHDLIDAINLPALILSHPELFDFKKFSISQRLRILREDYNTFAPQITPTITSFGERVHCVIHGGSVPEILAKFDFTDEELALLTKIQYVSLLKFKFNKYFRKELFLLLSQAEKKRFFIEKPMIVSEVMPAPSLNWHELQDLSRSSPKFIDQYITDFSKVSSTCRFWDNMFSYDAGKYSDAFMKNTKCLRTKTDVRSVLWSYPHLIKKLDTDILANSKLSCKEWVLLCASIMNRHKKIFANWEFPVDVQEAFKLDAMSEILSAKSTSSKQFSNAMKTVLRDLSIEENIEKV